MYVMDIIRPFFSFSTFKVSLFFLLPSGLALLGCSVSEEAMTAVKQVLESFPNLHAQFPVINFNNANQVKHYLETYSLQSCVLVVDGKTVKDAYDNLSARKVDYEKLLKTAVAKVGKISVKVFRYSFSEAISIFFNRFKSSFFLVRSL